ncbi:MAG: hypothetical protein MI861_22395, partial [Pirellulales bacterium]|nr:hypothetical protein [Pirellulales bacterium]
LMMTLRSAFVSDAFWAKCASLVLGTALGCFVTYVVLFLVAHLFASLLSVLFGLPTEVRRDSSPTLLAGGRDLELSSRDAEAMEARSTHSDISSTSADTSGDAP